MTARELLNAYPNCQEAVSYVEIVFVPNEMNGGLEDGYDTFAEMIAAGKNPLEVVGLLKGAYLADPVPQLPNVAEQMDHPEFLRYISGKMGAM